MTYDIWYDICTYEKARRFSSGGLVLHRFAVLPVEPCSPRRSYLGTGRFALWHWVALTSGCGACLAGLLAGLIESKGRHCFAAKRKFQNEVDCGSTNFLKILETVTLEGVRCSSGAVKVYQWHTKSVDRWVCLKIAYP